MPVTYGTVVHLADEKEGGRFMPPAASVLDSSKQQSSAVVGLVGDTGIKPVISSSS
jgi:hypothetical protein